MRYAPWTLPPLLAFYVGCVRLGGFACQDDEQCNLGGDDGVCQPEGFCSYPDSDCASGQRFEGHAGGGLAGVCVDDDATDDTATDEPTDTEDGTQDTEYEDTGLLPDEGPGKDVGCGDPEEPCCDGDDCGEGLWCAGTGCGCATQIVVGNHHSCAVKVDGTLWCWGDNALGQIGLPANNPGNSLVPTEVPAAFGPQAMATAVVATDHTCGLREDGKVLCWGRDDFGQVDLALGSEPVLPTGVAWADPVAVMDAGLYHVCAAVDQGPVRCWGRNNGLQLGAMAAEPGPYDVGGLDVVEGIALGAIHSCVLDDGGQVWCWGDNGEGQLGVDPMGVPSSAAPVPVDFGGALVTELVAGRFHNCALVEGEVRCWGQNDVGQVGDGTGTQQWSPQPIVADEIAGTISTLAAGSHHACALTDTKRLYCWGSNDEGQLMLPPDDMGDDTKTLVPVWLEKIDDVVAVSSGRTHTCVIRDDGSVWCWGTNSDGQLGDGSQNFGIEPTQVALECP